MSFALPFLLLTMVAVYWFVTQILPDRKQSSLLRIALGDGLLEQINTQRHELGLALLELDEDLLHVAERKAVHQVMTGESQAGWEYPEYFASMFGRSLLVEVLLMGPAATMGERLARQRDLFDGEWISCGIGVAGGQSGQVAVAMVLCREAWEPALEVAQHRSLKERVALGR